MDTNKIKLRALAITIIAASLSGCASTPPDEPFDSVRDTVYQRTGQRVQWNRSSADDRAAAAAVAKLLAAPLTAQSAVQIALLNNHDLQATYEDIGVAQADLVQAGLLKNPVFAAAFEPAEGGQGIKLQMSVMEDFLQILQIPLSKRIAGAKLHAATLLVDKAVIELAVQVRAAFYRQQAEQALADLHRTSAMSADAAMELAQQMHKAGNIGDLAFYQQQAAQAQARLDAAAADAAVARDREELNMLLGLGDDHIRWTIATPLPQLPALETETAGVEHQAVLNSFELAARRWEIARAAAEAGIKDNFAGLSDADIGPSAEKESNGLWETGAGFSIPLPIFDFGQSQQARARAELSRQRQRYLAMAVQVRAEARQAEADLAAARERAATLTEVIVPLRRKIVEQTQLQYNGMLAGPFDLLEARQGETDASEQSIQALLDYWLARTRVEKLLAGGT
jgi:outer membrane protein, heavy metal efflux system